MGNKNGHIMGIQKGKNQIDEMKLLFHCQLAHGSPTCIVSGFTNVKELYTKIAQSYDMLSSEILFCTLNTYKVDVDHLLGGQVGLDNFIFAHCKGEVKNVEIRKTQHFGITVTDNGCGYAFVKSLREGSICTGQVEVGDHIEEINGHSFVGYRHYEVAKALKEISMGSTVTMRLIKPRKWS